MFEYRRGEVYLVEEYATMGSEQKKTRPWVLVGASSINAARNCAIAIPLSTKSFIRFPLSVEVFFYNAKVTALIDQIRALDKQRFLRHEGELSTFDLDAIDDALRKVLTL